MEIRFDDRVAIVTGAGAGLGRSHARLLASRGARVVVNDLGNPGNGPTPAQQVVAEIRAEGGEAIACHDSVAEDATARRIVEAALDTFGRLDIVVNNAGILRDRTFAKMDMADLELVLRVHLLGTAYVTRAAWRHMLDQTFGRIVFTSSASGLAQAYGQANYGAAKAGMIGLMNSLKSEGAKSNVLVNTICPLAATRMTDGLLSERLTAISAPEHVSSIVAWLSSEACTMNGEILSAGAGHYALIKIMKSQGIVLDPEHPATIEDVAARMQAICDLDGALPYVGTMDARTKAKLGL